MKKQNLLVFSLAASFVICVGLAFVSAGDVTPAANISTEKAALLTATDIIFDKIQTDITAAEGIAAGATALSVMAQQTADEAKVLAQEAKDAIDGFDLSDITNKIDDIQTQIDAIDSTKIQQAIDDAADAKQAADAAAALAGGYDARITSAEQDAAEAKTIATNAQSIAAGASSLAGLAYTGTTTNASAISALDTRVTAIENSGGGGTDPALAGRVTTLEDRADGIDATLMTISTGIAGIEGDVSNLDDRITAIEVAPAYTPVSYSTNEQEAGYNWIDGSKVYQKTIAFGALPNATTKRVSHGIAGIGRRIRIEGDATTSDYSNSLVLPHAGALVDGAFNVSITISSTEVVVTASNDLSSYSQCYITLFYTKQ